MAGSFALRCRLGWLLVAAFAGSAAALADTPKTLAEEVRAAPALDPEKIEVTPAAIEVDSSGDGADLPAEVELPAGDSGSDSATETPGELLEEAEPPRDARTAFEQALAWAQEGVKQHRQGDWTAARKNLHDARIALLEAQLPEALQERGLAVLDCALGSELGRVDLEALAQQLEESKAVGDGSELAERDYIEREARRILAAFGDTQPRPADLAVFVDEVHAYVEYYQGKQREFFERSYVRKHKYWPTIREVFAAKKIPIEQGYMAFVESGFNPLARSHADARGLWQFIPGTGRRYGLERAEDFYDVQKSTVAAAEYLLDLIGIFGSDSFLLATASYNAGEGRIMGCLRRLDDPFGGRSFWEIRGCLARETREYVPRIFAAAIIGSDPRRFGFDLPSLEEQSRLFDVVRIPYPTSLATIAVAAGTGVADLRAANSDLSSAANRTPVRNFPLYVPAGSGDKVTLALQNIRPERVERAPAETRIAGGAAGERRYQVRRGDTLSAVASRHRVSVAALARANALRKPYRLSIGQSLIIPAGGVAPVATTGSSPQGPAPATAKTRLTYTVQPGNSLQEIADLFSVQYRDLLSWNNLRSRTIKAGQKLVIYPRRAWQLKQHTVRRGESPGEIARRYGVPTQTVLIANGLGRRSVIHPGAKLRIYVRG